MHKSSRPACSWQVAPFPKADSCFNPLSLGSSQGTSSCKKDSIGARHFRKGLVPPPSESELVETVKNLLVHRIMQKPAVEPAEVSDKQQHSQITQKS